jgi:hypothetical protein
VKLSARITCALFAAAALTVLIGTIWVAASGLYNPTPTILGVGVTIGLTIAAVAVWRESNGHRN